MKDLARRTITAVVFAAVMLAGIVIHEYGLLALMLIIHSGCMWEYYNLISSQQQYSVKQRRIAKYYVMIAGTFLFYLLGTGFRFLPFVNDYLYFFITPILLGYLVLELFLKSASPLSNAALNIMGVIYISLPLSMAVFFPYIKENTSWFPDRCGIILCIVLLVWANDTMAYFTGSLFGKHKMFPSISPKKSWEGFFGGLIFSMFTGWILSMYFHQLNAIEWITVGMIVSAFGTTGDLVESMIKRIAGVKDSGSILPGHGGFLDRFDAFIFCIPFVFIFYMIILLAK
jgi:phosphatidate cytidylyltransferase